MKTLEAHEQSLSKIFSDDYVFTIPGYQRPYSWTTEQAGELLTDILDYIATSKNSNSAPPYFLGSIVLIKKPSLPAAQVVDGQQRLTTLTLLLSAIRHQLESAGDQKDISALLYERGNTMRRTENRYRLTLRDKDKDFFRTHVQDEGGFTNLLALQSKLTDSQKNLQQNAVHFRDKLTALPQSEKLALAQCIVNSCYLVAVCTPDEDSAFRIFNVLNSRGLDLSATDILKSKIVGQIPDAARDSYTKRWEEFEETLGRESFAELFSHIRMMFRKAKPQSTLLKEFEEHVQYASPQTFMDCILGPLVNIYREINDADCRWVDVRTEINLRLQWINRIPFKDWMPSALAFISRHENAPQSVLAFLQDLERLTYSMLIRKTGINDRIERFSALTIAIEHGDSLSADSSPLQLTKEEIKETVRFLDGPLYSTHSARACAIILVRLDSLLSSGGASYDYPVITVEHVLPQNPNEQSNWLVWFAAEGQHSAWVNRIGNLALLTRSKNSAAKNYEFEQKKDACFKKNGISPFVLTTQIIQQEQWTPDVVSARQQQLMTTLQQHWRLPLPATP